MQLRSQGETERNRLAGRERVNGGVKMIRRLVMALFAPAVVIRAAASLVRDIHLQTVQVAY